MTNRENVLRALRRDNPGWVPFEFVLSPAQIAEFKRRTGSDDYLAYYGIPVRTVELNPTQRKTNFAGYYAHLPADAEPLGWNPEWGVMGRTFPGRI